MCPDWADPRNVGSAFRLADAAGINRLVLGGTTPRPPHPKIDKTARSTVRSVRFNSVEDTAAHLTDLKERGHYLLALEITDSSQNLLGYTPPENLRIGEKELYLVAGTEAGGIASELLELCDAAVYLPMHGQNTSMNVAMALGAATYLLISKL